MSDTSHPVQDARDVAETIWFWQDRGITAAEAWRALGNSETARPSWATVRAYMLRWLAAQRAMQREAA